jgi:hypothetical protein
VPCARITESRGDISRLDSSTRENSFSKRTGPISWDSFIDNRQHPVSKKEGAIPWDIRLDSFTGFTPTNSGNIPGILREYSSMLDTLPQPNLKPIEIELSNAEDEGHKDEGACS